MAGKKSAKAQKTQDVPKPIVSSKKSSGKLNLYAWPTPNGLKATLLLEELGVPYHLTPVDLTKNDQRTAEFLKLNPNGKIPVLVDESTGDGNPVTIWESGAILLYLAEKYNQLMPKSLHEKAKVYQWLMFQMSAIGPIFGQTYFLRKKSPEAGASKVVDRYVQESIRLLQILDLHLGKNKFLTGDTYTIADIALFPWIKSTDKFDFNIEKLQNLCRWRDEIAKRPAVPKAISAFQNAGAA